MKRTTHFIMLTVAFLFSTVLIAQSTITGTVTEAGSNIPLPGANIIEKGTTNGVTSDFDGNFTIKTQESSGELVITFIGYTSKTISFSGDTTLESIALESSQVGLEEVQIIASVAVDRKTPVAVSTIKAADIALKLSTHEFPEILKSTPGVYATKAGGGYGDGRINLRGFNSENVAVMINGVPVNDMENGRVFWSNWAGLGDVTSSMQVQRGLGASKVAVASIGGTINIITKSTDAEAGGNVFSSIANDGYLKYGMTYSTGLSEKGFAATLSASKISGDGYIYISSRINDSITPIKKWTKLKDTTLIKPQKSWNTLKVEQKSKQFRRSIYFIKDLTAGATITEDCIRCVRPGYGLEPRYWDDIIGVGHTGSITSWRIDQGIERLFIVIIAATEADTQAKKEERDNL